MDTLNLSPRVWSEFIGQSRMKRRLQIHIHAAFQGKRPLEHVLLAGPPGFGKTTLATLIADELTDPITTIVMPMARKPLIRELANFGGGVLFLDEIHALTRRDQELLLPVLDRSVVVDDRGREYPLGWVTVIGATTEPDKMIAPLHDRFAIRPDFVPYTDEQLGEIVLLMAQNADVAIDETMAIALGRAAGGIPRMAKQFVYAARDLAALGDIPTTEEVLDLCSVDQDGLTSLHQRYLEILGSQSGPVGQKTIEMMLRVPPPVIRDLERLLLSRNLVEYTPGGRQLTPSGLTRVGGREARAYVRR